jgi:hypothetical protein
VERRLLPHRDHRAADGPRLLPHGAGAEYPTIAIAVGGVAIFGYVAAQAFDAIANELAGDARKERQRHVIGELTDHKDRFGSGSSGS